MSGVEAPALEPAMSGADARAAPGDPRNALAGGAVPAIRQPVSELAVEAGIPAGAQEGR